MDKPVNWAIKSRAIFALNMVRAMVIDWASESADLSREDVNDMMELCLTQNCKVEIKI